MCGVAVGYVRINSNVTGGVLDVEWPAAPGYMWVCQQVTFNLPDSDSDGEPEPLFTTPKEKYLDNPIYAYLIEERLEAFCVQRGCTVPDIPDHFDPPPEGAIAEIFLHSELKFTYAESNRHGYEWEKHTNGHYILMKKDKVCVALPAARPCNAVLLCPSTIMLIKLLGQLQKPKPTGHVNVKPPPMGLALAMILALVCIVGVDAVKAPIPSSQFWAGFISGIFATLAFLYSWAHRMLPEVMTTLAIGVVVRLGLQRIPVPMQKVGMVAVGAMVVYRAVTIFFPPSSPALGWSDPSDLLAPTGTPTPIPTTGWEWPLW